MRAVACALQRMSSSAPTCPMLTPRKSGLPTSAYMMGWEMTNAIRTQQTSFVCAGGHHDGGSTSARLSGCTSAADATSSVASHVQIPSTPATYSRCRLKKSTCRKKSSTKVAMTRPFTTAATDDRVGGALSEPVASIVIVG